MTISVVEIWRFPIKSHGREPVLAVELKPGETMPGDRVWAVAHEESDADGSTWVSCHNFSRSAKAPALAAIRARSDETTGALTLEHPDRDPLHFDPQTEGDKLVSWTRGFVPEGRAQSARLVRARNRGFTDSDFASVTIGNMASHRAVSQRVGHPLSLHRWRCNIWIDGAAPWEEFDWMDRPLQIGEALLVAKERTDRCLATHANPDTGRRDADILNALESWGHQDFSVRAEVVRGGRVAPGDLLTPL